MKNLLTLMICIAVTRTEIAVLEPEQLRLAVTNDSQQQGLIDYSISTFGHILYADTAAVEVLIEEDNELGCSPFSHPSQVTPQKFVWLVDQGGFAWKFAPDNVPGMMKVDVLGSHYVYSDMTGGQLLSILPQ